MADLPAEITFGKVTGRFLLAVADDVDTGSEPNAQPAVGTVKIVPRVSKQRVTNPEPTTVGNRSIICSLDTDGRLVDAMGSVGVWLVTGHYDVTFAIKGLRINPVTIEVTAEHTALDPLDLAFAIPPEGPVISTGQYEELSARIEGVELGSGSSGVVADDTPAAPGEGESATYFVTDAVVWPDDLVWSTDPDGGVEPTIADAALVSMFTLDGTTYAVLGSTFPAPAVPDVTAPTAGTLSATDATETTIVVSVTGASDETALHATPYAYSSNDGGAWSAYQAGATYTFTGLTTSTSYTLRHRVRDAAGNVTVGTAVVQSTDAPSGDVTAPTTPTGLTATATSSTTVDLAWTASSDAVGVTGYEYRINSGAAVNAGAGVSGTVTGLTAATLYSFQVRAYDAAGNRSGWSNTATATTNAGAVSWDDAVAALTPTAWWKLDASSGTSYADSSGNGHTGTLSGAGYSQGVTKLIPGSSGAAISFSGAATTGILVPDGAWMDGSTYTLIVTYKGTNTSVEHKQVSRRKTGSTANHWQMYSKVSTGYASASVYSTSNTATGVDSTVNICDGNAHLLVLTVTAGTQKLYVNGTVAGTANLSDPQSASDSPIHIGADKDFTSVNGTVDDVIYIVGTALSDSQVTALHSAWSGP